MQWIVVRILGTIPAAPLVFGRLIDESCLLWEKENCGIDRGSCLLYDNKNMAKYMLILALCGKLCSVVFFFFAWFYYIPPKISDLPRGGDTEEDTKASERYVKNDELKY